MKTFVTCFLFLISSAAFSKSIKIFETKLADKEDFYRMDYRVNKSLNRAWVEITTVESSMDDSYYHDDRALVPGLSYDPSINGLVYDLEGEKVICGTFYNKPWTIDLGMSLRQTGRCGLEEKVVEKEIDNGYEIYSIRVLQVFFTVE